MSQSTFVSVKMFKCNSACVRCIYLLCLILLALTKDSVEAQELRPPASDFSRHRIVQPAVHHGRTKREISSTRYKNGAHHSEVTVKVDIDGEEHVLDLRLNEDLVTDNHVISYQKNGQKVLHKPTKEDLDICQYSGSVRGKPGSWAAVSTCHGVRGVIYDGKQMRYIEPAQGSEIKSAHYIYDHSDLNTNYNCGYKGGVTNNTAYDEELLKRYQSENERKRSRISRYKREAFEETQVRGPYNANKLSRFVELVLVVDYREYQANGESIEIVHRQMKDVANIINSVYSPLNIFIALVGVVVWSERDEIQLEENGDRTLTHFLHYRKMRLVADIPNDNAQLLTRQKFTDGVVGKALKGPICTFEYSGGVSTNHSEVIGLVATTIAHEMGHNFGMEHDTEEDCECPDDKCIMSPSSTSVTPVHWSSCSLKSLALAFEKGMDYCLRNKPARLFDAPTCGNGFVEAGEQCDCGLGSGPGRAACRACCRADCMLRHNASCAAGHCCDLQTCRPKAAGTVCRSADKECDLPEYCTGHSEFCPKDVYKMDSTPCGNNEAYCVRGSCRSHTDQCRLLWGPTGESSHSKCYTSTNIKGSKNGNCGYDRVRQIFRPCEPRDASCGLLHCRHLNERLEFGMESVATLSAIFINNNGTIIPCRTAIIDLGLNDVDPGLVPDGAKCGENKMCLSQKCVSVEAVRQAIANGESSVCPSNCSGHGVCNSEGHCHCEPGFGPPLCAQPGPGGSRDSGPATDPSVQKNFMVAMYIIFLGIIPSILLVLFLIYYSKHSLVFWWKKPRKSYVNVFTICTGKGDTGTSTKHPVDRHKPSRFKFNNKLPRLHRNTTSLRKLLSSFKRNDSVTSNLSNELNTKKGNIYVIDDTPTYANVAVVIKTPKTVLPSTEHAAGNSKSSYHNILHLSDKDQSKKELPSKKFNRKINKEDIKIAGNTELDIKTKQILSKGNSSMVDVNKTKGKLQKEQLSKIDCTLPKEIKPKLEIIKTGLASTTNETVASGSTSRLYNIKNNNLGTPENNIKVHGIKNNK